MIGLIAAWLAIYACFEAVWLSSTFNAVYKPVFQSISGQNTYRAYGGLLAYASLLLAWYVFVIGPMIRDTKVSLVSSMTRAAILAFAIYGVYNGTNLVTFSKYPIHVAIIDCLWGIVAMTAVTAIVGLLQK